MMMKILLLVVLFKTFAIGEKENNENGLNNVEIIEDPVPSVIDHDVSDCGGSPNLPQNCAASKRTDDTKSDIEMLVQNDDPTLKESSLDQSETIEKNIEISTEDKGGNDTAGEIVEGNELLKNISKAEGNSTIKVKIIKQVVCNETNVKNITDVQIINATQILKLLHVDVNITGKATPANCHLVYFFSPYCEFSVKGSPYINALARSIINVPVFGLDSIEHHNLNSRFGVAGTPSLVLFHNGLIAGRYNASEFTTSNLMSFIQHYTDQKVENINVTSSDFKAVLPSQIVYTTPYVIYICWLFIIADIIWFFMKSRLYARITEIFVNNWREAEAQHEHEE